MARKIIKNNSLILALEDFEIVKEVCEKISETRPTVAEETMELWVSHNRDKVPVWY